MKKLTRNFFWMAAANIGSAAINLILYIHLARKLGADRFGKFSFVQALVLYMFNFIDLGLFTFGTREVAKNHSRLHRYVNDIVSLRLFISAGLYAVLVLAVILSRQAMEIKTLMVIMALWLFSFALASEWAFQGLEKMHMVFISLVATSALQFFFIYFLVDRQNYFYTLPAILFLATLPIIVIYLSILKFKPRWRNIDFTSIKVYLSSSLIIWGISLFAQVYNGLDIVMMGWMRPPVEVGYFTIARRLIGGLTFLSIFMANAALPRYAASLKEGLRQFTSITRHFLKTVIGVAALLSVALVVFSRQAILITVGAEYLAADTAIKVLMLGAALVFLNLPFSTALIAARHEKEVLKQAGASAVLNVVLNLFLIPRLGMEGAAISFVCAEALALIWVVMLYKKKILTNTALSQI